jgi:hypothetical protein
LKPVAYWSPTPLQNDFSWFSKMKYFHEKEILGKNEENHLKEQNKLFLMVYGLPK